jgi:hypothetical protein
MGQPGSGAGSRRYDLVLFVIEGGVIDAVDQGNRIGGHGEGFVLYLESGGINHDLGALSEVAADGAFGIIDRYGWIRELARALNDEVTAVVLPRYIEGISRLAQHRDRYAVDEQSAFLLVGYLDTTLGFYPVEKPVQRTVGGVLFDRLNNGGKPGSHFPPHIDDEFFKILPADVMPQGELADSAEAVDAEYRWFVFENLNGAHPLVPPQPNQSGDVE